jgi:hypothetical protein
MPYPLRNLLSQLEVKGTLDTGELVTDAYGNSVPGTKEVYLRITTKSSSKEKYFRSLSSSGDNRLPTECYILESWEMVNGIKTPIVVEVGRLNHLLSFSTGTLSIYSKEQIDLAPVQKIFGTKFFALLDGFIPTV